MTAHFDPHGPAVVIDHLDLRDPAVVAEARRWSTGHRGAAASVQEMAGADLTAFATLTMVVGSHAIATAGGVQEAYDLEALVTEVGERTAEASRQATEATGAAIRTAAAAIETSTTAARTAIGEIGAEARRAFAENVDAAGKALTGEINRLVAGENPELLVRLTPVLDRFGRELEERASRETTALIARVARQLDPADPASPMAQQSRALAEQNQKLAEGLARDNAGVVRKLEELAETVKLAQHAATVRAKAISASTLKGKPFEDAMNLVMTELAAGFGDEYVDTSTSAGRSGRGKKGDGVLALHGGDVRIVVEMSDSDRGKAWSTYLAEAECNRGARASLGVVRTVEQLGGHSVLSLGPRRMVMAFDPETDPVDLVRVVLQLLRLAALAASHDEQSCEVRVAEEKIAEAIGVLGRIDKITRAVGTIRREATAIGNESESLHTELSRLLTLARTALGVAVGDGAGDAAA